MSRWYVLVCLKLKESGCIRLVEGEAVRLVLGVNVVSGYV